MRRLLFIYLLFCSISLFSQQNIGFEIGDLRSPQVNTDNTVTFRLLLKYLNAENVTVKGDWEQNNGFIQMEKDSSGIWSCTTPPLTSGLYSYCFYIESLRILDPSNPYQFRDVGSLYSIFVIGNGKDDYYCTNDVEHGNILSTWYHSDFFNTNRRLSIYTPPGYEKNDMRYPVLYLLHGSGGDEQAWLELGRIAQIMDNLIAQKKATPMIVVMPNGNPSKQAAPGYTNDNFDYIPESSRKFKGYKDGTYEMNFREIVSYTDSQFRTINKKSGRAIAGLSMGGFHSLMISVNHPELFDYIGLFSAGLNYQYIDMSLDAYNNLDEKLKKLKDSSYKIYWIGIGKDDFLYENNMDFKNKLDSLDFSYTYFESSRGHIWSNWRLYMLEFAPLLFK